MTIVRKMVQVEKVLADAYKIDPFFGEKLREGFEHLPKRQKAPPPPPGGISIRAGARRYSINSSTLSRWIKKGYLQILERRENWVYVRESDLARLTDDYHRNPGHGRWTVKKLMEGS